jgi:P-type E1-E2 ATPase
VNSKLIGVILLKDTPKPEASEVISQLKKLGIKMCIFSGDNQDNVDALAKYQLTSLTLTCD